MNQICPAVNFGERVDVAGPDILLLHYTGMNSAQAALDWLCCKQSGVSCHYFIDEEGAITQLVPENKRAHHAGAGSWEGQGDINSRSIGIEIVNAGHPGGLPDFPMVQMEAVAKLSIDIIDRHNIMARRVLAHSDVAPGRKEDPGEKFDWAWLAEKGVGHWIEPSEMKSGRFFQQGDEGVPVEAVQLLLRQYGYEVPVDGRFDNQTHIAVAAFQRHFRQAKVDGVADFSTMETLRRLLSELPE